MSEPKLPPVVRSINVEWDQKAAFDRFTKDFSKWWPSRSHSIGAERVKQVVLEPKVGGRIFEEHVDGRRFQWGQILEWDPPRSLRFTFHPGRAPELAQDVVVRFTPEGKGTRVELTASNWENWGAKAQRVRRGYNLGWKYILNIWAGQRTASMAVPELIMGVAKIVSLFRGGTAGEIARAGGEIARAD